jgi:hypothetical protein
MPFWTLLKFGDLSDDLVYTFCHALTREKQTRGFRGPT